MIMENGGGVKSSMIYLICCKNFCKCHSIPPPSTTTTKKENSVNKQTKKKYKWPINT
jgi:hypothetical protein